MGVRFGDGGVKGSSEVCRGQARPGAEDVFLVTQGLTSAIGGPSIGLLTEPTAARSTFAVRLSTLVFDEAGSTGSALTAATGDLVLVSIEEDGGQYEIAVLGSIDLMTGSGRHVGWV